MCGILAILDIDYSLFKDEDQIKAIALGISKKLRHRGPDWSGLKFTNKNNLLCHERLAIVGLESGSQPITNESSDLFLCVNGEIYNYLELKQSYFTKQNDLFTTDSDCEIIMHLLKKLDVEAISLLRGMFSFVYYDNSSNRYIIARDPIGITTLYYGYKTNKDANTKTFFVSSEIKAIHEYCDHVQVFPPGHFYDSKTGGFCAYYNPTWYDYNIAKNKILHTETSEQTSLRNIREGLEASVRRRLMSEVPFGVLLSGGLDSSLIASITVREAKKLAHSIQIKNNNNGTYNIDNEAKYSALSNWPKIHTFSIGLTNDSPDALAAKKVAEFLDTKHHAFTFTVEDGLNALKDVIYHLETYDVTTIRASTPMYLLSRKIKAMGVKMVLSGEGSDEIFGGYLYFHKAPNKSALQEELVQRVRNLHYADCLRANKSTMAFGVEARVPFLDVDFLDIVMNIDAALKLITEQRMEKYILRKAFDDQETPYLPKDILWRQKEQFSDGVGYSWIDSLKEKAELCVSDQEFEKRHEMFEYDTPDTKEAFWYRKMFDSMFDQKCVNTVKRWIPRSDWGCSSDPSGRSQSLHTSAYEN